MSGVLGSVRDGEAAGGADTTWLGPRGSGICSWLPLAPRDLGYHLWVQHLYYKVVLLSLTVTLSLSNLGQGPLSPLFD